MTAVGGLLIGLMLVFGTLTLAFVTAISADTQQISSLQSQITSSWSDASHSTAGVAAVGTLPMMNQTPTVRQIWETWYKSPEADQDRFEPSFLVVNQGDTVFLTLINNDTVAHDIVIGPPYNIVINATVPGLVNDLTGQTFTTNAENNSPGVRVEGKPGNVTATYDFVVKYAGIFEFVCTYHAQVGMIGYLTVLPNAAYEATTSTGH